MNSGVDVGHANYRGSLNTTASGYTCQAWNTQLPHQHSRTPTNYPDSGLGNHNYCRNPDKDKTIWCYTTDPKVRWDYCDIKQGTLKGLHKLAQEKEAALYKDLSKKLIAEFAAKPVKNNLSPQLQAACLLTTEARPKWFHKRFGPQYLPLLQVVRSCP